MAASGNNGRNAGGTAPGRVGDVLVVGGGLAGWRAASAAVRTGVSVRLVANGAGNSPHIHALNCPVLPGDSAERMYADTLSSGHDANDPALVRALCAGAVALKDEFPFDREADGSYKTIRPLGSSVPRCVSIGHAIGTFALLKARAEAGDDVAVTEGRVVALSVETAGRRVFVARLESGEEMRARAVVLATGGWCGKYAFSTNPPYLRGDGLALAQSLGAAVRDMDAVQYEPTVRVDGPRRGVPVITTLLYAGARLLNDAGVAFLPDARLNKDELSRAIFAEMGRTGAEGVWYDLSGCADEVLAASNMDLAERRIRVAPAPHTSLGGVAIDVDCHVLDAAGCPIPGLFAAGEVTGGLHGRNRLGGNAGTEVLVFGRIAGLSAAYDAAGASRSGNGPHGDVGK